MCSKYRYNSIGEILLKPLVFFFSFLLKPQESTVLAPKIIITDISVSNSGLGFFFSTLKYVQRDLAQNIGTQLGSEIAVRRY